MWAVVVALGLVMGLLSVLVVGLLRSHAEILRSLHDLGINADGDAITRDDLPEFVPAAGSFSPVEAGLGPGHDISGTLPGGGVGHVAVVGVPHDTVLAFLTTGCATCAGFWDALSAPGADTSTGEGTRVVVVTKGPEEESEGAVLELAPESVPTLMSSQAWTDYRIPASPFFLRVHGRSGQVVGEGSSQSWDQVLRLLERSEADTRASLSRSRREFLAGGSRSLVADRITSAAPEGGDVEVAP